MPRSERNALLATLLVVAGCIALLIVVVASIGNRPPICAAAAAECCGLCDHPQILRLQDAGIGDVRTLDPPNAVDPASLQIAEAVYPGLVVLDKNLTPIPWAAQALPTVSSDGLTYTFTVKPGLKWSDDTPITSETFAFSMNRALNPCNAFNAAYYLYAIKDAVAFNVDETCVLATHTLKGPIKTLINDSITTPNAQTLVITLQRPAAYFLAAMSYPASYAVPEQLIKRYGASYTEHMADGSGFGGDLFKITRWDHAGHLTLTSNDAFWGTKPKLREVDYTFSKDATTAYNAYLAGQTAVCFAPASQIAQARTHTGFRQIPIQRIDYYAMNWRMKPFDDVRMRRAFAIAIDKQALVNDVWNGTVVSTNHIVPDGMPGYNPDLKGPDGTQSLTGATQMANQLATAYATETNCGTATDFSKCPKVALTIPSGDAGAATEAAEARQMWLNAMPNYPISIQVYTGGLVESLWSGPRHRLQFQAKTWIEGYPDPQDWLSTTLACDSAYNLGNACDQRAEQLMKAADANPDQAARLAQYQQAEQSLVTEVAWLPLDQATTWWEVKPWLRNFTIASDGLIPKESWQIMYVTAH
jgi:oligopeptide transport system substrate-binding protein